MLTEQGHVKVMDFGLAKRFSNTQALDGQEQTVLGLTQAGTRVGTPGYMSPEQILGGEIDGRSDIFSFGIILYELVVGTHPFRRATPSETLAAILRDPPAAPTARPSEDWPVLRVLLDKLMAKEVARRPQTFQEVRQDLRELAGALAGRKPAADGAVSTSQVSGVEEETRCVGRETERAELQRVLDRAVGGNGALVLIGGELGIGKTRLAEELLQAARQRDCLVLTGRCHEMDGTPPFIPFVEALEQACRTLPPSILRDALADAAPEVAKLLPELDRLFPDIPSPASLPAEHQRRFLFNSVCEFLDRLSRVTPLVLLLDDLHWADESTLLLLHHLAQRLSEMSMLVLATYRDPEAEGDRAFAKTLETLTHDRLAQRLTLRRLAASGVDAMLAMLGGQPPPKELVRVIHQQTEGNPFFVEEVFRHLAEEEKLFDAQGRWRADLRLDELDVPEGVRLVVGRRLQRLTACGESRSTSPILLAKGSTGSSAALTLWRMTMGTRDPEQPPLWIATSDLPVSPGHPFYTRLNALLDADSTRS